MYEYFLNSMSMDIQQTLTLFLLIGSLILFAANVLRFDVVSLLILALLGILQLIPVKELFSGFSHPAVITVAAVLVMTKGLQNAGLLSVVSKVLNLHTKSPLIQLTVLCTIVAALSGFMNDIGALALVMPFAIQVANASNKPPSYLLMPLAFCSLLGGVLTLMGTPPNIIIALFRQQVAGEPFHMFDFTPAGVIVAAAGIVYLVIAGPYLLPIRKSSSKIDQLFHTEEYTSEITITEDSPLVGLSIGEIEEESVLPVTVLGIVRREKKLLAPTGFETLWANDRLLIEASPVALKEFLEKAKATIFEKSLENKPSIISDQIEAIEGVIAPNSLLIGKTARSTYLRLRFGINLIGIARGGARLEESIGKVSLQKGDILLLQGPSEALKEALNFLNIIPLAYRDLQIGKSKNLFMTLTIFVLAVFAAAIKLFPIELCFTCAALGMVLLGSLSMKQAYEAIDWPIIVLLGGMIPLGKAFETTGLADTLASQTALWTLQYPPWVSLASIFFLTMILSNILNNATVAVLMAPFAYELAQKLSVSFDPFLMGVAFASSFPFLTPMGHQSCALVMEPGGYKFIDYSRVGFLLTILVWGISVWSIPIFWPF